MEVTSELFIQLLVTLVGIFIGTLAAMGVERINEKRLKVQRAKIILRSLSAELTENYQTLKKVRNDFLTTPWGKSFYVSTIAWETALSGGDLPGVIGFALADSISAQYAHFVRLKYYVDLMTGLWFSTDKIPGYKNKRDGFNRNIVDSINRAIDEHQGLMNKIKGQKTASPSKGNFNHYTRQERKTTS